MKAFVGANIEKTRSNVEKNFNRAVMEASYLDYDAKAAEADFVNITKFIQKKERKY